MKLELKRLTIATALSEETLAFAADVHLDGILVGHAKNTGNGGMVSFRPKDSSSSVLCQAYHAHLATLPPRLNDGLDLQPRCIEDAIEELAEATHRARYLRSKIQRLMRTCTVFVTGGALMTVKAKGAAAELSIAQRHADARVLNSMSLDDAVNLCLSLD